MSTGVVAPLGVGGACAPPDGGAVTGPIVSGPIVVGGMVRTGTVGGRVVVVVVVVDRPVGDVVLVEPRVVVGEVRGGVAANSSGERPNASSSRLRSASRFTF
jgi:hypothetical protein